MVVDRILKWAILLDDIELKPIKRNTNQIDLGLDLSEVALLFSFGKFVSPESPEKKFFILNRIFIEKNTFSLNPNVIIFRESNNQDLSYASLPDIADFSFYINEALNRIKIKNKNPHYHILMFDKTNIENQDIFLKTWIKQTLNSSKM